jgi:hypothetical protein
MKRLLLTVERNGEKILLPTSFVLLYGPNGQYAIAPSELSAIELVDDGKPQLNSIGQIVDASGRPQDGS